MSAVVKTDGPKTDSQPAQLPLEPHTHKLWLASQLIHLPLKCQPFRLFLEPQSPRVQLPVEPQLLLDSQPLPLPLEPQPVELPPQTTSCAQRVERNPNMLLPLGHQVTPNGVVEYREVPSDSKTFREISVRFPCSLKVVMVKEVVNPFLSASFQLTRRYQYWYAKPDMMFHGTKLKYVNNICTFNFNWRFSGAERGHKYGKGVYFTSNPGFAENFCDQTTLTKVIIAADVLCVDSVVGNKNMIVPPEDCDSSTREDGSTVVKFNDAEFCPRYVVFFTKQCLCF